MQEFELFLNLKVSWIMANTTRFNNNSAKLMGIVGAIVLVLIVVASMWRHAFDFVSSVSWHAHFFIHTFSFSLIMLPKKYLFLFMEIKTWNTSLSGWIFNFICGWLILTPHEIYETIWTWDWFELSVFDCAYLNWYFILLLEYQLNLKLGGIELYHKNLNDFWSALESVLHTTLLQPHITIVSRKSIISIGKPTFKLPIEQW